MLVVLFPPQASTDGRHIVLYDGNCGLCSRFIQFLLAQDREGVLYYSPLQSGVALELRERHAGSLAKDSLLFVRDAGGVNEQILDRSSGVLAILNVIGGVWRLVSWAEIVPRFARNVIYDFVAKNRILWFGLPDHCQNPTVEIRDRFLDEDFDVHVCHPK